MTPKQVLSAVEMFEAEDMRKRLMHATIKALKELKLDIRAFSVLQLQQLIKLVAHHAPEELSVFYKFIETAAGTGMFNNHFEPLARLFYLFVEGYDLPTRCDIDTRLQELACCDRVPQIKCRIYWVM